MEGKIKHGLTQSQLENELLAAERERRGALVADDMDRFAALLADNLVHVHSTGIVHGKAELLTHAGGFLKFVDIKRGPLAIRSIGPAAAVMTGSMTNFVKRRDQQEIVTVDAYVTQVWVRNGDRWQICSFHATRQTERPA